MNAGSLRTAAVCLFALIGLSPIEASAQDIPPGNITMVVPFAAGGPVDLTARVAAPFMAEKLDRQIIIENVGGAGGMSGSTRVKNAVADGRTLLVGNTGTHAYNQWLYKRPQYDSVTDFTPVGIIVENFKVLVVRKDMPVKTMQEFVAHTKTNQAKMQFASAGMGSGTHISCVILNSMLGVSVAHVAYRGAGPAMQDLVGGRIDYMCEVISTAMPQIEDNQIRAIAMLSNARSKALPNLPSSLEQGVKDVDADGWNALFMPKGAPAAIVSKLNEALNYALDRPDVRARYTTGGLVVPPAERRGSDYLARAIKLELARSEKPIKSSGASVD